jgi:hypothetical protein
LPSKGGGSVPLLTGVDYKLVLHYRPFRIEVYAGKDDLVVSLNSEQLMKIEHLSLRRPIETHRRCCVSAGMSIDARAHTHFVQYAADLASTSSESYHTDTSASSESHHTDTRHRHAQYLSARRRISLMHIQQCSQL